MLTALSSNSSLVAQTTYLKDSGFISSSPMPAAICCVGLFAKQFASHAQAAASHRSESVRNLMLGPLIVIFLTKPAIVVISVRQDKISFDISGARMKPCEPKLNAERA